MNISDKITPRDVQAQAARPSREHPAHAPAATGAAAADAVRATPQDSVAISAAGRARAGRPALSPERIHDIRQKIASGAYDAPSVVATVAQRILQRGDL